ncbi:MAG: peptidoglycan-binding domain-containing protein [Anaerolineales bacterium]
MPVQRPMLRFGSRGEQVTLLQGALNLWPEPTSHNLETDGIYGPKTLGEVKRFQSVKKVSADGVVGPVTWGLLEPLLNQLVSLITPPKQVEQAMEAVVAVAETALASFGWPGGTIQLNPLSARIAAAKCAAPDLPTRPRQGGLSIRSIFQFAGAQPLYYPRCTTISTEAEQKWQQSGSSATAWRNGNDLPSWCGIFCYYVYRLAGIDLGGWVNHDKNIHSDKKFIVTTNPAAARRGSIGCLDGIRAGGHNHHFIVKDNHNGAIYSIDGNTHGPNQNNFQTNYSTVARRRYPHTYLKQQDTYFLFPDFKKIAP